MPRSLSFLVFLFITLGWNQGSAEEQDLGYSPHKWKLDGGKILEIPLPNAFTLKEEDPNHLSMEHRFPFLEVVIKRLDAVNETAEGILSQWQTAFPSEWESDEDNIIGEIPIEIKKGPFFDVIDGVPYGSIFWRFGGDGNPPFLYTLFTKLNISDAPLSVDMNYELWQSRTEYDEPDYQPIVDWFINWITITQELNLSEYNASRTERNNDYRAVLYVIERFSCNRSSV